MPIQTKTFKKKKYERKNLVEKIVQKTKDVASSRGARQAAVAGAVIADLSTGAKVAKGVVSKPIQAGAYGIGKLSSGAGYVAKGLGSLKKTASSAYNRARYGSTPSVKKDTTLRLGAGTKPLGLPEKGSGSRVIIPKAPGPRGTGARVVQPQPTMLSGKFGAPTIPVPNNPLNTTGLPKGPGTASGSFKLPKSSTVLDSNIQKTKASAKKRAGNVVKAGQKNPKTYGNFATRDQAATKAMSIRNRANVKVDKIASTISKNTGKSVNYVKAANKKLSTPQGKADLNKAYKASSGRVRAKGGKNVLNPAGAAVSMVQGLDIQKNPEKYQKGIFGGTVGINSLPGYLARTSGGKKLSKKVTNIKGKISKRFKF